VKFTGLPCDPELEEHVFMGGIDALVDDAVGATQSVTIREPSCDIVPLFMDIKPGSCPNSFNRGSEGVLPVSILGTMDFDVAAIDVSSVVIAREDGIGGSAAPYFGPNGPRPAYGDLATPFTEMLCGCHELKDDGFMDLSLKFDSQTVVSALQLNDLPAGAMVVLKTTGMLWDGRPFEAKDCIRLVPPHPSRTGAN
jgi:hypothetical protein